MTVLRPNELCNICEKWHRPARMAWAQRDGEPIRVCRDCFNYELRLPSLHAPQSEWEDACEAAGYPRRLWAEFRDDPETCPLCRDTGSLCAGCGEPEGSGACDCREPSLDCEVCGRTAH